ncbi:MAG TPA: hypothetical protein VFU37_19350 [Pyrinomonadaceae bacterium]|nr:hypothetical protein [Pyrinomonadaceae bacterium]
MTQEEAEKIISALESGFGGIEAYLELSAAERAKLMASLEQRANAQEIRQILEQCEADGTMDKIAALLAEHQTRRKAK